MPKMCNMLYASFKNKFVCDYLFKPGRFFHSSILLNIMNKLKVNEYLFNRAIPATEVLNSLTEEDKIRLENIKMEHQTYLALGEIVPDLLRDVDLLELLCLNYFQRKKYFSFLTKKQFSKENDLLKKSQKIPKWKILNPESEVEATQIKNNFFGKYYMKCEKIYLKQRLFSALMLNSQQIIFDFGFEDDMTRRDVKELSRQFQCCYSINKSLRDPFQMVLTSLKHQSLTYCDLNKYFMGNVLKTGAYRNFHDFPFVIYEKPFIEVYPDKKLIYLSPDSKMKLQLGEYDHDAIYVVGAIVDRDGQKPLTLSKARHEGLEHRSLPLDDFVQWKQGYRGLPLNICFQIMSIARETSGDWKKAIQQSIPSRMIFNKF